MDLASNYLSDSAFFAALDIKAYTDNFLIAYPSFRNGDIVEPADLFAGSIIART